MEDGSRIDLQDFLIVDFDLYGGNPQFPIHSFYSPRFFPSRHDLNSRVAELPVFF
jgi:hypothetical protein